MDTSAYFLLPFLHREITFVTSCLLLSLNWGLLLTLLHYRVLAVLNAIGFKERINCKMNKFYLEGRQK